MPAHPLMTSFHTALTRTPGRSFAQGLTTAALGAPQLALALAQHAAYCQALQGCGLRVISLPADDRYPDSTFVEDTAVLTPHLAVLTRPGAPSRQGEVPGIRTALEAHYQTIQSIQAPGTVDGGDICQAGEHFFIGLSARTNPAGAHQLAALLQAAGYTTSEIDIRSTPGLLHLKSGLTCLQPGTLLVVPALAGLPGFKRYHLLQVPKEETYAANCIRVNDFVLLAAGFPRTAEMLAAEGFNLLELDMSEFRKMDGGLSCLSLRF